MIIIGIVLSGGRSSRFGRDKGLFPFRGKPLVEHALDILMPNVTDIRISTNQPETYGYLGLPMIGDIHQGCGPLGGMHAALLAMPSVETRFIASQTESRADEPGAIAVISCDTPFVPPELYAMMVDSLGDYDAAVPVHGGFKETTCAIYTTRCLPAFEVAIREKRFKILDALTGLKVNYVNVSNTPFYHPRIFHNINSMDDTKTIGPKEL